MNPYTPVTKVSKAKARHEPIKVFEHSRLDCGTHGFKEHHWRAMDAYNERHGGKYFTLTSKGVKFNQFVGVIQVDELTIEILPKVGRNLEKGQKETWQKVLIDMLRTCHWMQVTATEPAALRFKPNSILEAYLEIFVNACEQLYHQGLTRKYRQQEGNVLAWKGKLLFQQQMRQNLVHQERFYTRHQVYNRNNVYNQILLKALKLLPSLGIGPYLKDRVYALLLAFPELEDVKVTEATFAKLIYDRKTAHYRPAMEIAAMLLLNYRPDIRSGHNQVLAILFDMNELWEEYIYRQLARCKKEDWEIRPQRRKTFWQSDNGSRSKVVRPDIFVQCGDNTLLIDTKWKLPDAATPADADLKQMYVYNEYFNGNHALLLYPNAQHVAEPNHNPGKFKDKNDREGHIHSCGMLYISVLNEDQKGLDKELGQRLGKFIEQKIFKSGDQYLR